MKALVIALLALTACKQLPDRPDEAKFKAMESDEKCRATASRAIMCTDALMVESVRSISDLTGSNDFTDEMAKQLANEPPKPEGQERKANIQIHKTTCAGDIGTGYVDGIFRCWAIEDCKKFAACVYERPAAAKPHSESAPATPHSESAPATPPTAVPKPDVAPTGESQPR